MNMVTLKSGFGQFNSGDLIKWRRDEFGFKCDKCKMYADVCVDVIKDIEVYRCHYYCEGCFVDIETHIHLNSKD